MKITDFVIDWLLEEDNPSVAFLTLVHLLDYSPDSPKAKKARKNITSSFFINSLFKGQRADGGFGCHPYDKWMGAHWRLRSAVDLAIPEKEKRAVAAINGVLHWLTGPEHAKNIRLIDGRIRRCGSQEGNALGVCSLLGLAGKPEVKYLAESLISWQWPDGGWNCDKMPGAHHSSFYESVIPMWGLLQYHCATGDNESLTAAMKTAEFILRHRLFLSDKSGEVINPRWLEIRYPHYWHYDILQGLTVLLESAKLGDPRCSKAIDFLAQKCGPDGRWKADGYHWRPVTTKGRYRDPINWWRREPNKMITLNALRILKDSGRIR